MTENKNYTIGLDIGTNSVGWAVIDDDFNLIQGKKKIKTNYNINEGKVYSEDSDKAGQAKPAKFEYRAKTNLWGVRLFEDGKVAADRRLKRGTRRRIARRKKRLQFLREIFSDEILTFDDSFFIRLDESFYQNDDAIKKIKTQYPLFNGKIGLGETFDNEVDYYKEYPTIYHLRNRLVSDKSQADLRLVYLALHHILKYRGHFTNQGQKFDLKNINVAESL
ncbi:MAG: type II CRISPR RNA-guided endonuclease Cas9, partial [Clostridiales Family XIII bacterium]|nr:type II CRISPR RNA-guided endonuclease Cas9 [Clostridiales Family XIII bacterium]